LSTDNIRVQLLMIEQTFRSGHIPIEMIAEMIRSYTSGELEWGLSWRRFMEGIICGDYRYHRTHGEDPAMVINVFESGDLMHDFCNSLCIPRMLQLVDSFSNGVLLNEVFRVLEIVGYPKMTLRVCMERLMLCKLVHSPQGLLTTEFLAGSEDFTPHYVSTTSAGRYYIRRLVKELVYIQYMSLVTSLEPLFQRGIEPWEPQEVGKGAASAAALIAQISRDDRRERDALSNTNEGRRIGRQFAFGRLAHDMAIGCRDGVNNMLKAAEQGGYRDKTNWREVFAFLNPPPALTV